MAEIVNKTLCS